MEIFDCQVEFGRRQNPPPRRADDAAALVGLLRKMGVARALAVHSAMHELDVATGNARVVDETRDFPQLQPTWALLPPQTNELGDCATFFAAMRANHVRALRAFPRTARFTLDRRSLGPLLDEMARLSIPLLLNIAGAQTGVSFGELAALLAEAPANLPIIGVLHDPWGEDRYFRPLLDSFPNLYLGLSGYLPADGITALVDRYGAARFLYGSSFPDLQPGGSLLMLLHAGLPDDALAAIAGGNLSRLLSEVPW